MFRIRCGFCDYVPFSSGQIPSEFRQANSEKMVIEMLKPLRSYKFSEPGSHYTGRQRKVIVDFIVFCFEVRVPHCAGAFSRFGSFPEIDLTIQGRMHIA